MGILKKSPDKEPLLRYSRSVEPVRNKFRFVLQYTTDDTHTPYVFDACLNEAEGKVDIQPENEPARDIWISAKDPRRLELELAMAAVFEQDIDSI
jgi:hypothetical protein